jgi:lysozyme
VRTSDKGIVALMIHEGIVPGPYLDSVGVWTYGIGHAETSGLPPNPRTMNRGMPADLDTELSRVFDVFRADLPKYEAAVRKALPNVKQHEFDAALSFHFNTGAIGTARWVPILRAGDAAGAARSLMANWSGKNPELKERREAERDLMLLGRYPTGAVTVWQVSDVGRVIWKPAMRLPAERALAMLRRADPAKPAAGPPVGGNDDAAEPPPSGGFFMRLLRAIFGGGK